MREVYYALNPWWENKEFSVGVSRERYLAPLRPLTKRRQIEILIGSRRAGKTTLLKQLIKGGLSDAIDPRSVLYLALDHPQMLDKTISEHLRYFRQLFEHSRDTKLYLFFDEVQESRNWQTELKAIYDLENVKLVCTGSTASLINSQGGKLTGRQIVTTVYPLSYDEFLMFKGGGPGGAEEYRHVQLAEEYLQSGGYPENALDPSQTYLTNLLDDILARDIVRLFAVRKAALLKDLFRLTTASVGSRVSYNKMSHTLGVSLETVKEYLGYFESAFLTKTLEKWTTSNNERIYANRKIYLLDTGFKALISGPGDLGAKAENAVFLHLLRNQFECGYFAHSQKEVDFVLGHKNAVPLEVKYEDHIDIADKRLSGLRLFLKQYPETPRAVIVTKDYRQETRLDETKIEFIPLWEFLLES